MGNLNSSESGLTRVSQKEISSRFALKCGQQFSGIEIWAFKDVFRRHAKVHDQNYYWTAEEFAKFLDIPDSMAESVDILYSMVYYLCLFPFLRARKTPLAFAYSAPTPVTFENILKVVVLFTGRYKNILTADYDFLKLLFCAVANYEHAMAQHSELKEKVVIDEGTSPEASSSSGKNDIEKLSFWDKKRQQFDELLKSDKEKQPDGAADSAPSEDSDSDDDEMLNVELDNIKSWFELDLIRSYDGINIDSLRISPTTLYHLFTLLLAVAPLQASEPVSTYEAHFSEPMLSKYHRIARDMTRSFAPNWRSSDTVDAEYIKTNGISYTRFYTVVKTVMPFAFDSFEILFERFLFNRKFAPEGEAAKTVSKAFNEDEFLPGSPTDHPFTALNEHEGLEELEDEDVNIDEVPIHLRPRLPEPSKLMDASTIAQLATFMNINSFQLYGGLKKLYVGSEAGFSMGSFEQKVFKWNAPTILLIRGYMLSASPQGARERSFADQLPPVRYGNSNQQVKQHNGEVIFGAVVNTAWKASNKKCFGDASTALFQLEPIQDVFRSRTYNDNYAYFSKTLGIGFGNLPPKQNSHQNNGLPQYSFGDVSLTLEPSFEFGIFRNVGSETFRSSEIRQATSPDFEDRFAITEMEVWGVGADEVLREQASLWAWEEREALRRKNVNLSKDVEESRMLLEMAGIVGGGARSGGSI
ncbi:TLD-domain-containing protein [Lipomyces oligophaga]|uniref:TLD-domain-containing protein n=1 Tax=Lipomyces oligophaga TaxID=45792 RepID=UPI0034CEA05B